MFRRLISALTVATLAAVGLVVPINAASATTEGIPFSADALPTWRTNGVVWNLASAQGKVFAGGTFSTLTSPSGGGTQAVSNFATFDAATGNPTTCLPAVTGGSGTTVRALAVSPDGSTLYIGGSFGSVGGVARTRLAAVDVATCTVKTSFAPPNISSTVRALAVSPDGSTLYIGGDFQTVGGQPRVRFAALDAQSGALVPGVVADADAVVRGIAVSPDGSTVMIGGYFFAVNGVDTHSIAALSAADGSVVKAFPRGFIPDTSVTHAVRAGSEGFIVSNEGTGGGVFDGKLLVRYSDLNQQWRDNCLGATQDAIEYQSVVYAANHAHDCTSMGWFGEGLRYHLTAHDVTDAQIKGWLPNTNDGIGEGIGPRALTVARSGGTDYLWVGGEFTYVNGVPQQGLTRFGPTDTGRPGTPVVTAESLQPGKVNVRWQAVTDPDDQVLTYNVYRNNTLVGSSEVDSFPWTRPQGNFVDTVAPGSTNAYRVVATDGTNSSVSSATVSVTAATAADVYADAVLTDEPSSYLRLEESAGSTGSLLWDSASGGPGMSFYGSPAATGKAGAMPGSNSVQFAGSGNNHAYARSLHGGQSSYSVELWFKTTTTQGGKLIGFGNGLPSRHAEPWYFSSGNYDRHVYMRNDGRLTFGVWTGSAQTVTSPSAYNDGQWHQLTATQGPTGMALYVDGMRVGRNGETNAQAYPGSWRIGGDNLNGWPNQPQSAFFAGEMDEVAIYSHVLAPADVAAHYGASGRTSPVPPAPTDDYGKAVRSLDPEVYWRFDDTASGSAVDSSAYLSNGVVTAPFSTLTRGAQSALAGQGTSFSFARNFLGQSAVVATPTSTSNPRNYALELWFRTATTTGGKLIGFGDQQSANSSNYDRHVYLRDDGRLTFGVWTGQENTITSPIAYNDNTWHHLVASQSSTDGMRMYVDGVLVGTHPQTGAQDYSGFWRVGGDTTWGGSSRTHYSGLIDEVAVYNNQLTSHQVEQHYLLSGRTLADNEAPSAPNQVTATIADDSTVEVTWAAATDNRGVSRYEVRREEVGGGTVDVLGTVQGDTFAYLDESVAPGEYRYEVVAEDAAGNRGPAAASDAVAVQGPDTQAPTAPAGVSAQIAAGKVEVTWSPAQDDRGVVRYTVHRATSIGVAPTGDNRVGDVESTSFSQDLPDPGDYYYTVVAHDAAGNRGPGGQASVLTVVPPPAEPVTVQLDPEADTYVNQGAPNTAYGTHNNLTARAGTVLQQSYLRFDVPAVPAGTELKSATLRVRLTSGTNDGSAADFAWRWVDAGWDESSTFNTRPTVTDQLVGQWTGTKVAGSTYTIELDPAAFVGRFDGSQSVALTTSGDDNVRIWSREATTAAARPQLTLEFGAP